MPGIPKSAGESRHWSHPTRPWGRTRRVNFTITRNNPGRILRQILETGTEPRHVNRAVCGSSREADFRRIAESHPQVIAYVKNQGLELETPYKVAEAPKTYLPCFIVRMTMGAAPPTRSTESPKPKSTAARTPKPKLAQ